ncbi:baseplate J/gp47 family protein [Streptomyces albus]|uniref:baseplate J/gp47 family protein n=1 Tax=Streptomyces albus TaxID=1888 RepID=UPI00069247C5|nr:baseplate J/gp47 family protein [Streptomyces albus]
MTAGGPGTALVCRGDGRRGRVRGAELNGVDAVEVSDDGRTLTVTFLGKAPRGLCRENIRVDGGRRVTGIEALEVEVEREDDPELDDRLYVTVDKAGDTSRYRLSVVETDPYGRPGTEPYRGFDQRYHAADFFFRPDCPTPFDCADEQPDCPPTYRPAPVIDYTARDYDSLRQVVLDRLALTSPGWVERHAPDLGVTLVELLAHTADLISYQQDAVATEAYLDTARRRVSVRRHVRLVDYPMHDGCNARAHVAVEVARPLTLPPGRFRFASVDLRARGPRDRHGARPGTVLGDHELTALDERAGVEVFEPVEPKPLRLRPAHNTIRFWTWGGEQCSLPKGATSATLRDEWAHREHGPHDGNDGHGNDSHGDDRHGDGDPGAGGRDGRGPGDGHGHHGHGRPRRRLLDLSPGDLLVFEEVRGPRSGTPGDADPAHRQAVRLTSVTPAVDRLCGQPVLEITWAREDALRFPLCLSTTGGTRCEPVPDVSVARGNIVLVDHGRSRDFCEDEPEHVTVPPVPAAPPGCEPPAFGCADRAGGNEPARLTAALLDLTDSGRLLTPAHVREVFTAFGEDAAARAGLGITGEGRREEVVPDTAQAQAAALRTLLAQSVYPGIVPRFRPVLDRFPVVQAVPFPEPRLVAAGQAERLAAVPERVRQRLVELWRSARDRDGLSERETAELAVLFGLDVLERLELRVHPRRALRELLVRSDRLLARKKRRLEVLAARARAGTVLDRRTAWEIAHCWGPAYAAGLDPDDPVLAGPAAASLRQDPRAALPAVRVLERTLDGTRVWEPRRDLLGSGSRDRHFTGELEDDGRLALRFGDGVHGAAPEPGTTLELRYRLGGGTAGNVGAEAVNRLVLCGRPDDDGSEEPGPYAGWDPYTDTDTDTDRSAGPAEHGGYGEAEPGRHANPESGDAEETDETGEFEEIGETGGAGAGAWRGFPVIRVRNPLPAAGGTDPEPVEQVRRLAPLALKRTRLRAVTAADYAELASAVPGVQRAAAEMRWTGSTQEAHVAVDALGTGEPSPELLDAVARHLEDYRRIGHDVVVVPARTVPLDIALTVCAAPGQQRGPVLAELHRVLGSRALPDGRLGFFHPDALGFGEPVRLSRLVAVAAAVPGVRSVHVTRLRRLFGPDAGTTSSGGSAGSGDTGYDNTSDSDDLRDPALDEGLLRLGPLEIAQCDNDPDRPENGRLELEFGGGQ